MQIIDFIKEIYKKNDQKTSKYYEICKRYGRISKKIFKIAFGICIANGFVMSQTTTIEYFRTGELKPCYNAYFPGIYDYSGVTKALLLLYNYTIAALAVFSGTPGDLLFIITFAHIPMVASIIRSHLQELDGGLGMVGTAECDVNRKLIQYLFMHQKLNE